jgi:dual specificity tyrosine-phosphorylation-regulated kinase 2/3/4
VEPRASVFQIAKALEEQELKKVLEEKEARLAEETKARFAKTQEGRCPQGYTKQLMVGQGGSAMVWLAERQDDGDIVALKQFPKEGGRRNATIDIEVKFQNELFPGSSTNKSYQIEEAALGNFPGYSMISRLLGVIEGSEDTWLVYEAGGESLGQQLYNIEVTEGSKDNHNFSITHGVFYEKLSQDVSILAQLIARLALVLDCLQAHNLVHSDLKPDNILVEFDDEFDTIEIVKLVDFGSTFKFNEQMHVSATTPEYISPEMIDFLYKNMTGTVEKDAAVKLFSHCTAWSSDVWSLGIIILEILTGIPVWL